MKNKTMQELDEQFKDFPSKTNVYEIDGVKHNVISHFVGEKDINMVMFDYAYNRVLNEMINPIPTPETT